MRKEFRNRYTIIGILFTAILGLLVIRLFNLQFVHGQEALATAQNFSRKDIRMTGQRGKILDSNGLPLAYNKTSYSVVFNRNPDLNSQADLQKYTQAIIGTIKIVENNGGKFLSTFAIHKLEDGTYEFSWPGLDKAKDQKTFDARVKKWKDNNCVGTIKKTMTPEQLFEECRKHYGIPEDATYEEAYKILSVWQEARAIWYASYIPVVLAQDVNYETVAEVKMSRNELPGMDVEQSSTRVYPNKTMAAHIIGYTGQMLDEPTMKAYQAMGYKPDDIVGVTGVELTEEAELTGNTSERTGTKVVEVDNMGGEVREITGEDKPPVSGNNVMLTIDSNLQKRLEKALEENIAQIRAAQETQYQNPDFKKDYDDAMKNRKDPKINYADTGGAVVMDVQTGDILAMASYPSFDLNEFTGGISDENYQKLVSGDVSPLFNNAVSSKGTPGSIFKMCTGLAGLMEPNGITLDTKITDRGEFREHLQANSTETGPKCWVRNPADHTDLDIVAALKFSCNYFFFTVANKIGVDRLNNWADLLGLTAKTGVELPDEVSGQVGKQATLYSSGNMSGVAALVRNNIVKLIRDECVSLNLKYDDEKYTSVALELMDLVNQNLSEPGPDIRAILKNELKIDSSTAVYKLSTDIALELYQIEWNPSYTVEDGIGQSVTLLTPIGVARYVSAIVNGGNVFEARLVKEVIRPDGTVQANPPKLIRSLSDLGVKEEYLNALKEGMKDVVSNEEGTASGYFKDFDYMDKMGGKTGTAQVNKAIDLENNSWFVAFAPYDKPEIAVVVYIPHGYKGALSSYTVKQVIQYYMDKKKASPVESLPQVNMLVQ